MKTEVRASNKTAGGDQPGIIVALDQLGPNALVNESALARLLGCHPVTVKRAVRRGELPPPVRLMGKPTWTVGAILAHFDKRLEITAKEAEKAARKVEALRP